MVDKGKGFQIFAHILLSFLIICAIAPFILLIMSSITEEQTLITNGYSFFPEKFSTYAYEYLFTKSAADVYKRQRWCPSRRTLIYPQSE